MSKRQTFIAATETFSMSDGHPHTGLLDCDRIAVWRWRCLVFHDCLLARFIKVLISDIVKPE
jgi:hypothetical protein